jgi:hypothetical protein
LLAVHIHANSACPGGVAGGDKYIVKNILFKVLTTTTAIRVNLCAQFALDSMDLYKGV